MSHSRLAASASSRWLVCPGSIRLIEKLKEEKKIPQERTNDAAQLGTAVHYMVEQDLLGHRKALSFLGESVKADGMKNAFKITEKEVKGASLCVRYVKKILRKNKSLDMFPERKYDLTEVYDIEMGGTSDVTIAARKGTLEITDYKNGKWPVNVIGNTQLRIYGLGAYHHLNSEYKFKNIKLTIVQPNSHHEEGPIRSEEFSIKKLLKWENEVLKPVLEQIKNKEEKLVPNEEEQCYWCDAKAHCPARKANKPKFVKDVLGDLIPTTDIGHLPEPEELSKEDLEKVLQNADDVIKFYSACKKYAFEQAKENKESYNGFGLIPRFGNRRFVETTLKKRLKSKRIKVSDVTVHEDRLMTPVELENYLKNNKKWESSAVKDFMEKVTERPKTGQVLVKVDTAEQDFADIAKSEKEKPLTRRKRRNRRK